MKARITDICEILNGYAFKSENYTTTGIRVIRIANVQKGYVEDNTPQYYPLSEVDKIQQYILNEGDILLSLTGNVGRVAVLEKHFLPAALNQRVACLRPFTDTVTPRYLYYALLSSKFEKDCIEASKGIAQKNMSTEWLKQYTIKLRDINKQHEITNQLDMLTRILTHRRSQLSKLDELVKCRFVEMFGDPIQNKQIYKLHSFTEFAYIDAEMTTDYHKYANYPHIGIDSIEKETGRLIGYRTVAQDGVISGKYLFSPEHLIYSKIRPNLNKVACPDFHGVCSADSYPIRNKSNCNKYYLLYVLRSQWFLDYIVPLSSRTNLPKVNRKQIESFTWPLPPIELQNQFEAFVRRIDKLRFVIQKSLDETQKLFDSLMQEYFD